jgi:hypothetical protein
MIVSLGLYEKGMKNVTANNFFWLIECAYFLTAFIPVKCPNLFLVYMNYGLDQERIFYPLGYFTLATPL